ncbi:hypothetical protein GCM10018781_61300 [Kitasatospora indigofera]|uniref:Uncharacterized protein n=1 Tax=Kitasatospora indigofera TaxID=67307 RepID=A0A919L1I9_9ACTN|nr:hypothetical protein GCM10018781_61300 [Kitasatospora indigofera]
MGRRAARGRAGRALRGVAGGRWRLRQVPAGTRDAQPWAVVRGTERCLPPGDPGRGGSVGGGGGGVQAGQKVA